MPDVPRRNVGHYMSLAIVKFYSRIFLRKLTDETKKIYRYVEKCLKSLIKTKADQEFLKFCSTNQLLPKFVNFKLYDVSANFDPSTVKFKLSLLDRELLKKEQEHTDMLRNSIRAIIELKNNSSNIIFYSAVHFLSKQLRQYILLMSVPNMKLN